jgi:hypothetical protein
LAGKDSGGRKFPYRAAAAGAERGRGRSDLPRLQSLACSSSPGLACLVYIATYVVLYAKAQSTNSDAYSRAELEASGIHILEASCVPSSDIGSITRYRWSTATATRHRIEPWTPLLTGICHWPGVRIRVDTIQHARFCAGAYSPACGAQDRGEDGADVCLYATASLYQTCRTKVRAADLSCAAIGGQIKCLTKATDTSSAILHLWAMRASLLRDVGGVHAAVCRRRVSPTMLKHAAGAAPTQNILRSHSWATTRHDARRVYPLQVQDQ